jgi:hypothetical protein
LKPKLLSASCGYRSISLTAFIGNIDRNMPPIDPTVIRTLIDEAKRLRGQLTLWLSVVEGHHPVRLIYVCQKLDRALKVLEIDLEWERQLAYDMK